MRFRQIEPCFSVSVNISDKFVVVDLVKVALVHIFLQEQIVEIFIWWSQVELFQYSAKLVFSHVSYFGDIEILKLRLQVQSLSGYDFLIPSQQSLQLLTFLRSKRQR